MREKSGLAYYAHSMLNAGIGPGTWVVSAGVNPKNVEKTIDLVTKELRRFVEKGIRAEELADSQSNFIGRLPLALESNAGMANAMLNIERYDLGLDYYQRYPDLVGAVTRDSGGGNSPPLPGSGQAGDCGGWGVIGESHDPENGN